MFGLLHLRSNKLLQQIRRYDQSIVYYRAHIEFLRVICQLHACVTHLQVSFTRDIKSRRGGNSRDQSRFNVT